MSFLDNVKTKYETPGSSIRRVILYDLHWQNASYIEGKLAGFDHLH